MDCRSTFLSRRTIAAAALCCVFLSVLPPQQRRMSSRLSSSGISFIYNAVAAPAVAAPAPGAGNAGHPAARPTTPPAGEPPSTTEGGAGATPAGQNAETDALEVQCSAVPEFPVSMFDKQPDKSLVYLKAAEMKDPTFLNVGFDRYTTVFGVPILASKTVTDAQLGFAANIFAEYLDNDDDGIPDRVDSLESVRNYNTIVGYLKDAGESQTLWNERFKADNSKAFREHFSCNIHFFEHWADDSCPAYHEMRAKEGADASCDKLGTTCFDWTLWYAVFTVTYYGFLDVLNKETIDAIHHAMEKFQAEKFFTAKYPDDKDMETADFVTWSLLTHLGAVRCHCKDPVINEVWKMCTGDELKAFDPTWQKLILSIPGLPKKLPTGKYKNANAIAKL